MVERETMIFFCSQEGWAKKCSQYFSFESSFQVLVNGPLIKLCFSWYLKRYSESQYATWYKCSCFKWIWLFSASKGIILFSILSSHFMSEANQGMNSNYLSMLINKNVTNFSLELTKHKKACYKGVNFNSIPNLAAS